MRALEQKFKDAGLICFNEIGVDPGVDHLWAIKVFDEVKKAGGKIKSFYSFCGGLVEPAVRIFFTTVAASINNDIGRRQRPRLQVLLVPCRCPHGPQQRRQVPQERQGR